jgi:3-methyladenine DNA glycosylase AlkC
LDTLELKERSAQIQAALLTYLPDDFAMAYQILKGGLGPARRQASEDPEAADALSGIALMPVADYVAQMGLEHFDLSMDLLREITMRSTSEFAIRRFLIEAQERTLEALREWAHDPDEHVRRLVSEGTRPRLPWAVRLPAFVEDPSPIFSLLEELKDDPSEYVRRSVANNLNDIAKDHPDRVAELAKRWLEGATKDREKLVRHALRTLVKQGHPGALEALGHGPPAVELQALAVATPTVQFGGALTFQVAFRSESEASQKLIVDYVIHHRKANGQTTPKVFKWKTLTLDAGETHEAVRHHAIKPITTRKYYPGTHFVELQINGRTMGRESFELEI